MQPGKKKKRKIFGVPYNRRPVENPSAWYQQSYLARDQSLRKEKAYWVENKATGPARSSTRLGQDVITSNMMILAFQQNNEE